MPPLHLEIIQPIQDHIHLEQVRVERRVQAVPLGTLHAHIEHAEAVDALCLQAGHDGPLKLGEHVVALRGEEADALCQAAGVARDEQAREPGAGAEGARRRVLHVVDDLVEPEVRGRDVDVIPVRVVHDEGDGLVRARVAQVDGQVPELLVADGVREQLVVGDLGHVGRAAERRAELQRRAVAPQPVRVGDGLVGTGVVRHIYHEQISAGEVGRSEGARGRDEGRTFPTLALLQFGHPMDAILLVVGVRLLGLKVPVGDAAVSHVLAEDGIQGVGEVPLQAVPDDEDVRELVEHGARLGRVVPAHVAALGDVGHVVAGAAAVAHGLEHGLLVRAEGLKGHVQRETVDAALGGVGEVGVGVDEGRGTDGRVGELVVQKFLVVAAKGFADVMHDGNGQGLGQGGIQDGMCEEEAEDGGEDDQRPCP